MLSKNNDTIIQMVNTKSGVVADVDISSFNNEEIAYEAFKQFKYAFKNKKIDFEAGQVHKKSIILHKDSPRGEMRLTYGIINPKSKRNIMSSIVYILTDPYKGLPCFDVGYSTDTKYRGKGIATRLIKQSIDEMKNGFSKTPMKKFYLEMKIEKDNVASRKVAEKVATEIISDTEKKNLSIL